MWIGERPGRVLIKAYLCEASFILLLAQWAEELPEGGTGIISSSAIDLLSRSFYSSPES